MIGFESSSTSVEDGDEAEDDDEDEGTTTMNLTVEFNVSFIDGNNHNGHDEHVARNQTFLGHDEDHRYSMWMIIFIIIVATCLSIVTVIGNIMVMISFKIDKQLQTISNYYLFSLAVADFAVGLISMPLFTVYTVLGYWPLGPHICDAWLALDYLASNASVLNLLIISFDRYFSVTRPLTYRAKRTTLKASVMIACAWGISVLLWPPWIYAWPYIEGKRTVPEDACYIQFIETNHYITFGTAIAAFYIPVSVMIFLYWRIWQETEKRQKDLPNLQAVQQDASKRSNSSVIFRLHSDEALDMDECKRARSESSTGAAADEVNSTHISTSYLEKHYPQHKAQKHRPLSWTWLKMWCVAWWHSGRDEEEEEDDDDEPGGPESSKTMPGYDDTLTPMSVETPLPSFTSQCPSLSVLQSSKHVSHDTISTMSAVLDQQEYSHRSGYGPGALRTPGAASAATISSRNTNNSESVYTILIKLPPAASKRDSTAVAKYDQVPSIKMYRDEEVFILHQDEDQRVNSIQLQRPALPPSSLVRRPSQMPDVRIPLSAKNIGKQSNKAAAVAAAAAAASAAKQPVAKKKKKSQEKKADRKAAKTLSAILAAFIITWTPYNILVLLKPLTACTSCIPQDLWDFFYYLCYINSTVNPVCYALCNATFRRTYVRILKCKWHSRNRTGVSRGY